MVRRDAESQRGVRTQSSYLTKTLCDLAALRDTLRDFVTLCEKTSVSLSKLYDSPFSH